MDLMTLAIALGALAAIGFFGAWGAMARAWRTGQLRGRRELPRDAAYLAAGSTVLFTASVVTAMVGNPG